MGAVILLFLLLALFTDAAHVYESLCFNIQSNYNLYFPKCFFLCFKCNYTHISYTLTLIAFNIIENTVKKMGGGALWECTGTNVAFRM